MKLAKKKKMKDETGLKLFLIYSYYSAGKKQSAQQLLHEMRKANQSNQEDNEDWLVAEAEKLVTLSQLKGKGYKVKEKNFDALSYKTIRSGIWPDGDDLFQNMIESREFEDAERLMDAFYYSAGIYNSSQNTNTFYYQILIRGFANAKEMEKAEGIFHKTRSLETRVLKKEQFNEAVKRMTFLLVRGYIIRSKENDLKKAKEYLDTVEVLPDQPDPERAAVKIWESIIAIKDAQNSEDHEQAAKKIAQELEGSDISCWKLNIALNKLLIRELIRFGQIRDDNSEFSRINRLLLKASEEINRLLDNIMKANENDELQQEVELPVIKFLLNYPEFKRINKENYRLLKNIMIQIRADNPQLLLDNNFIIILDTNENDEEQQEVEDNQEDEYTLLIKFLLNCLWPALDKIDLPAEPGSLIA